MSSIPLVPNPARFLSPDLREKLRRVQLVAMDVDGTLTSGDIFLGADGEICKRFDSRDGYGIHLALDHGLRVAFITGRDSPLAAARAAELHVEDVILGAEDKRTAIRSLAQRHGLKLTEIAFIGDDLPDAATFSLVGVGIAVGDATPSTRAAADYVTQRPGGRGAVREAIELILTCQGKWAPLVQTILGGDPE